MKHNTSPFCSQELWPLDHGGGRLDDMEKLKFWTLPVLELVPLGHPARRQSLYGLRYRDSDKCIEQNLISYRI
jgi:hypothetical protein